MGDWPRQPEVWGKFPAITPSSLWSLGSAIGGVTSSNPTSQPWPAANRVILVPFRVPRIIVARQMSVGFGGTAGGNFSVGIVDRTGKAIYQSASTARAASSEVTVNMPDTVLGPGVYYMALQLSDTSTVMGHVAPQVGLLKALGVKQASPGVFPMSGDLTLETLASTLFPWIISIYTEPT